MTLPEKFRALADARLNADTHPSDMANLTVAMTALSITPAEYRQMARCWEALGELSAAIEAKWSNETEKRRANALSPRIEAALVEARDAMRGEGT